MRLSPTLFTLSNTQENKIKAGLYMIRDKTEERCEICCKNESNTIIEPCMHGGVCRPCLINILMKKSKCPFCRKVSDSIQIYSNSFRKQRKLTNTSLQAKGNICTAVS